MRDVPTGDAITIFILAAHFISSTQAEIIKIIQTPSFSTMCDYLLVENILYKVKIWIH